MNRHRIVGGEKFSEDGGDMVNGGLQEIKQDDAEDDINIESGYFNKPIITKKSTFHKNCVL